MNPATEYGETALHLACAQGRTDLVQTLLSKGVDVNAANYNNQTPLHIAAEHGHLQIVELLVPRVADVNVADIAGKTALQLATEFGHTEIVTYLLDHGANLNVCDGEGNAALHAAILSGREQLVALLLERGADVKDSTCGSVSPLYRAVESTQPAIVRMLLARGADANTATSMFTALYTAINNDDMESVRALVDGGADVNKASSRGWTPLYIASYNGQHEIVLYLLAHGANPNTLVGQRTALYAAAQNNRAAIVRILVQHGAVVTRSIATAAAPALKAELEALYQTHAPKWGGFTKSDMTKMNAVFESPKGYSVCPICLKYAEHSEACNYMSHNCSLSGYYHTGLYAKYKNPAGTVYWCTQCGRICSGHKHYALGPVTGPKPALLPSRDPFARDCRVDGGGGVEEKVMRFNAMREKAVELQSSVGVIPHEDAMTALVETMWMPRDAPNIAAAIMSKKEYNVPLNVFPGNVANTAVYSGKAPAGVYEPPEILTGVENAFTYETDEPVIRFKHKDAIGKMHIHTMALSKKSVLDYLRRSGGKKANRCFECSGYLWPEEVEAAFVNPALGFVTPKERAALDAYRARFYRDYTGTGGRRTRTAKKTRKLRRTLRRK
jgi:ankyrin repeat protein